MRNPRRLVWLPLMLGANPAYAHAPVPGIKGFYTGLLHPFSTPSQALLMIGLGLLVGGIAVEKVRWPLGAFLIANVLGVFAGSATLDLDAMMFATAFAACAVAALMPGKLLSLCVALAVAGGFLIGSVSIPDDGPTRDRIFTMSGSMIGANVGLLYIFGIVMVIRERFTWAWVAIALRVAAAWLAAISLLMLALFIAEPELPSETEPQTSLAD